MTNNRCVIVLALLAMMSGFFFFPFNLFPLDPEKPVGSYLHNVWDFEDGLPQNAVMSICQTSDGYLWMATQEGLVRYNGNHFEVFDRDNTKEITNNYIRVLWEDRFGVLWIGTSGGGVLYLENGTFHRLSKGEDLSRSQISAFCSYGPGALLIATRESGIYKVKGGVASVYPLPPACKDNDVLSLLEDHEGNIWAGTDSGGLIKTGKKKAAVYLPGDEVRPPYVKGQAPVAGQPPVMEQTPVAGQARVAEQHGTKGQRLYVTGLPSRKINVLYQDEEKTIWIGTDAGITRYRDGGFKTFNVSDGLSGNHVTAILRDRQGSLWICTHGKGISRFRDGVFSVYDSSCGLSSDITVSLLEGREGSLWIGTEGGGLERLKDRKFNVWDRKAGLSHHMVFPIFQDPEGDIYIGTQGGGVNRLHDGKVSVIDTSDGLSNNKVFSIYKDREGALWMGTYGAGLNVLKDGRIKVFTQKDGLSHNLIWAVTGSSDGSIWVGTDGGGVTRLKDGKFTIYNTRNGLAHDRVAYIHEDKKGNLWVGTYGGGLNLIREDGSIRVLDSSKGLTNDLVTSIYEDKEGVLWIGTSGGGLNRYKDGVFSSCQKKDGLFDNLVFQILEDDMGDFWMSCNKGIFRVPGNEVRDFCDGKITKVNSTAYGKSDGLPSVECNGVSQPPGCKTRDGRLWFPTLKGAVVIDPSNIKTNRLIPPVKIEKVVVDTRSYHPGAPADLPPGSSSVEIWYAGLSYLDPGKVKVLYKLEGFDKDWRDAGEGRTSFYTNLTPGPYKFRVKACNNDGVWNENGAVFSFVLQPYFYQTVWFYIFCALTVVFLAFSGYRLRVRQLRRRAQKLRLLVERQTATLRQQTRELKSQYKELEAIDQVVKTFNREIQLEKLLNTLLLQTLSLFPGADAGCFLIYQPEEKKYRPAAMEGDSASFDKNRLFSYEDILGRYGGGSEILEQGIHIGKPGNLSDPQSRKSMLAMAVNMEGKTEGFLVLEGLGEDAFDRSDTQKLDYFREHAVSAISKARVMEQLRVEKLRTEDALEETRQAHRELEKAKETAEKAKEAAEKAREMAERASSAKSEFLANMSHEIRTPMNAILGFTEVLEEEITNLQHKEYLEAITSSGKTLLRLINDILDLSRIEAGKMELQYETVEPTSIMNEIRYVFANEVREKGLDFITETGTNLPDMLSLDGLRVRQVLLNLVGNAVKFTDSGFIKLSAVVGGFRRTGGVDIIFSVEDTGIGIPADQLDSIFEAFKQQDGQSAALYGGTGLGLAITRRLVEIMGGTILVESSKNEGSTFRVVLKDVAIPVTVHESNKREVMDVTSIAFEKASILVADDNYLNRKLLQKYLAGQNFDIWEAENGVEAVEMVKDRRPDLVLMDMKMPLMDGAEAATRLRADADSKDIPIIFVTASALREQEAAIRKTGCDGFLNKPVSKQDLVTELMRFLPYDTAANQ